MFSPTRVVLGVVLVALVGDAHLVAAQSIIARDGWEAFPEVEYQGGDTTQPKKRTGMLVLTDTTLALHKCRKEYCKDTKGKVPFKDPPYFTVLLSTLTAVDSSSQVRGPSTGDRIAWGGLAMDHTDEFVGLVYETPTNVQAPIFRTEKAQSAALAAKIRFRLKKLGIALQANGDNPAR